MKQEINQLTPRHLKIVDLAIKGWAPGKIAKHLQMTPVAISMIMHSPTWEHEFALRRAIHEERDDNKQISDEDEVTRTLRDGAKRAAEKLVAHIDSTEESISVKSAEAVLDRTGYSRVREDKQSIIAPTIIINDKDSKVLLETIDMIES